MGSFLCLLKVSFGRHLSLQNCTERGMHKCIVMREKYTPNFMSAPKLGILEAYAIRDGFLEKGGHMGWWGLGVVKTHEIKKGLLFSAKECVTCARADGRHLEDFKHIRDIMKFAFKKDCTIYRARIVTPLSDLLCSLLN